MSSRRPRDIGTATETAVVRAIRPRGFPHAERRAMRGTHDAGDITGTPGICWSVKGGSMARAASDGQVLLWLRDLDTQRGHANASVGVLVLQRAGIGEANAHRWWAVLRYDDLERLLSPIPLHVVPPRFPVRLTLDDACHLLRAAGYGTPEDSPAARRDAISAARQGSAVTP